jgi:hypothetical protein
VTTPKTCHYMISRTDGLTGQWIYGYRCGKPSAPDLSPRTPAYQVGACLDHLNGRLSPLETQQELSRATRQTYIERVRTSTAKRP